MDAGRGPMLTRLLIAVGCCCAVGCHIAPSVSVANTLDSRTQQADEGTEVRLRQLTDFAWTSFVAVGPYTPRPVVEQILGFKWPEYDAFGIAASDAFTLLVFVDGGKVVRVEQSPRCRPDFAEDTLARRLTPDEAVFVLHKGRCNVLHLRSAG